MGAAMTTRAASASSKCALCCIRLGEALWAADTGWRSDSDTMDAAGDAVLTWERLTDRVLVSPISREMAALNRKSSVKWLVTWKKKNPAGK